MTNTEHVTRAAVVIDLESDDAPRAVGLYLDTIADCTRYTNRVGRVCMAPSDCVTVRGLGDPVARLLAERASLVEPASYLSGAA